MQFLIPLWAVGPTRPEADPQSQNQFSRFERSFMVFWGVLGPIGELKSLDPLKVSHIVCDQH